MSAPHIHSLRVYYEDTDFSGVVYHASYLRFMERGRTELLRELGVHQRAIHAGEAGDAFAFAVRRMMIEFLKPARMDDVLRVETRAVKINGASIELSQRILRGDDVLMTSDVVVAVVINGKAGRLPAVIRAKLLA